MGIFSRKKSTLSPPSAGISSSAQHITQRSMVSAENVLVYPGREKLDARALYMFKPELSSSGKALEEDNQEISRLELFQRKSYSIAFYHISEGKVDGISSSNTYQRQAWTIGIACNEFNFIRWAPSGLSRKVAHWGIYIRPRDNKSALHRIFGMNWENGYGSSLILSDAWGTPGSDQNGEWKKLVKDTEFTKITDRNFQEMTVYCSLEEFVLELQLLLRFFIGRQLSLCADPTLKYPREDFNYGGPGAAYSLINANCQDFAKYVMHELKLKYMEYIGPPSRGIWTDPGRLDQPFVLSSLESRILRELQSEHMVRYKKIGAPYELP